MVRVLTTSDVRVRPDITPPPPATVMLIEEVDASACEQNEGLVVLRYGPTRRRLPPSSWNVGEAKQWARSFWGVAYFTDAYLNGTPASLSAVPQSGDTLVFIPPPGRKGAEDWSDEAVEVFCRYPELRAIAGEVALRQLDSRRSVELALVMAVRFFIERCGQPEQGDMFLIRQVLKMLAELVERLAAGREPSAPKDVTGQHVAVRPTPETAGQLPPAGEDLTTVAAARELGCSRSTIYKLCGRGELAYRRVGNRYWIPRVSVKEYKHTMTTQTCPPAPPSAGYQFKHL